MRVLCFLTFTLSMAIPFSPLSAADAKWVHAASAHFDMYTSESESDAKAALVRLEATSAFFLAATHTRAPGTQPVRIVAFRSEGDYSRFKPSEVRSARAYGRAAGAAPATVVLQSLKPEALEEGFREYAQLALDESAPNLPYWFRAGLASVYSTLKPGDKGMDLGAAPHSNFRNGEVGDVSLPLLFGVNREALLASRDKAAADFDSGNGQAFGARAATLDAVQSTLAQSQDFARASWMLVHMLMFQPEYRTKFGEFMRTLAAGGETGAAFEKVYGAPVSKVKADLVIYSKQTGLMMITAPFKFEMPAPPVIRAATKEEQDQVLADLARRF